MFLGDLQDSLATLASWRFILNRFLPIELRFVKLGIQSVQRQQIRVGAALDDLLAVHHQDHVGSQDGAQAVDDEDAILQIWQIT